MSVVSLPHPHGCLPAGGNAPDKFPPFCIPSSTRTSADESLIPECYTAEPSTIDQKRVFPALTPSSTDFQCPPHAQGSSLVWSIVRLDAAWRGPLDLLSLHSRCMWCALWRGEAGRTNKEQCHQTPWRCTHLFSQSHLISSAGSACTALHAERGDAYHDRHYHVTASR